MKIKDKFGAGTKVVLKSGSSPQKVPSDEPIRTWSIITGLPNGVEGVVMGTVAKNVLKIKMVDNKGGLYRKGATFNSIADAWTPR